MPAHEDHKAAGNELFKHGRQAEAIAEYTKAIEAAPESDVQFCAVLYSNRSAAHLKVGQPEQAVADAREAGRRNPTWAKAPFREGQACAALGTEQGLHEAKAALQRSLALHAAAGERDAAAGAVVGDLLERVTAELAAAQPLEVVRAPTAGRAAGDGEVRVAVVDAHGTRLPLAALQARGLSDLYSVELHHRTTIAGRLHDSSRARMVMNGLQMVRVESAEASPVELQLGEFEADAAVEWLARRVPAGGRGVVEYGRYDLLAYFDPAAEEHTVASAKHALHTTDVEVFRVRAPPAPGAWEQATKKTFSLSHILAERRCGEAQLEKALHRRGQLDAFDRLKAAEDQKQQEAAESAWTVKKVATVALRHLLRAALWAFGGELPAELQGHAAAASDVDGLLSCDAAARASLAEVLGHVDAARLAELRFALLLALARGLPLAHVEFMSDKGERIDFGRNVLDVINQSQRGGGGEAAAAAESGRLARREVALQEAAWCAGEALQTAQSMADASVQQRHDAELGQAEVLLECGEFAAAVASVERALGHDQLSARAKSLRAKLNVAADRAAKEAGEGQVVTIKEQLDAALAGGSDEGEVLRLLVVSVLLGVRLALIQFDAYFSIILRCCRSPLGRPLLAVQLSRLAPFFVRALEPG